MTTAEGDDEAPDEDDEVKCKDSRVGDLARCQNREVEKD